MRYAWIFLVLMVGIADAQINPATQIQWPLNCQATQTVYSPYKNTCLGLLSGPAGPQGPQGIPGVAATIEVGTTTTGAAGTNAAVSNSGSSSAAVFNFTIPQGVQGVAGPQGPPGPGSSFTPGLDLSGTSTSQTVVGIQGNLLPTLAAGYPHWTGSAWVYDTPTSSGLPVNNPTYTGTLTGPVASFTGDVTFSGVAAPSAPSVVITSPHVSGGTGTTATPVLYFNAGANAPTTWSSSGTALGINAIAGFLGNYLDFHVNGGASQFAVRSGGNVFAQSYGLPSGNYYSWSSTAAANGTPDTMLCRSSAGTVEVGSGSSCNATGTINAQATTQPSTDNSTNIATTSFVQSVVASSGGMTYPAAGVAVSTGTSWGTSINPSTLALVNGANTFTAANTFSAAGAASTPSLSITGAPYTAGTGTTNTPLVYLNSGATAVTSWATTGTFLGINAPSGFTGNFLDFHVNGGLSSVFSASPSGVTSSGTITAGIFNTSGSYRVNGTPLAASNVGAEPALGNPTTSGYVLSSTSAGVRSWIAPGGSTAGFDILNQSNTHTVGPQIVQTGGSQTIGRKVQGTGAAVGTVVTGAYQASNCYSASVSIGEFVLLIEENNNFGLGAATSALGNTVTTYYNNSGNNNALAVGIYYSNITVAGTENFCVGSGGQHVTGFVFTGINGPSPIDTYVVDSTGQAGTTQSWNYSITPAGSSELIVVAASGSNSNCSFTLPTNTGFNPLFYLNPPGQAANSGAAGGTMISPPPGVAIPLTISDSCQFPKSDGNQQIRAIVALKSSATFSQLADLDQWLDFNANILSRVNANGTFIPPQSSGPPSTTPSGYGGIQYDTVNKREDVYDAAKGWTPLAYLSDIPTGSGTGGAGSLVNLCSVVTLTNATCSSGIISVTPGSSNVVIAGIPGTYNDLYLTSLGVGSSTAAGVNVYVQFNGDTAAHYVYGYSGGNGSAAFSGGSTVQTATPALDVLGTSGGFAAGGRISIPSYASTTMTKNAFATLSDPTNGTGFTGSLNAMVEAVSWNSTSAINTITLTPAAGTISTMNISLTATASTGSGSSGSYQPSSLPSPPQLSTFTWANQGTATATQATNPGLIYMNIPNNAALNWRLLYTTMPATPYRMSAYFNAVETPSFLQTGDGGLYLYDGTKLVGIEKLIQTQSATGPYGAVRVEHIASVTADGSTVYSPDQSLSPSASAGMYVAWCNNGTNIYAEKSIDGVNWISFYSEAATSYLANGTYGGFGGVMVISTASQVNVSMMGWQAVSVSSCP